MEKYIKNKAIKVEFGDYNNFATLIPLEIVKQFYCNQKYYPQYIIKFAYANYDNRTIDLVIKEEEIDFDSFAKYQVKNKKFLTYRQAEIYCGENNLLCKEEIYEID